MPGINNSGAPSTRDYTLGRGVVRFAKLTAAGVPDSDGFRDLGNAPEFSINVSSEELTHQSSREQIKFTDKRVTISQEIGVSFQLDEMNFQNLADAFSGTTETYDNPHDTVFSSVVSSSVKKGAWYQLKDASGNRVYNLGAAGLTYAIEQDPAGTPVVLVAGTDYEIDEELGLLRILPGSAVLDGDTIGLDVTAGASTPVDLDQVNALQVAAVEGALLFVQENAADGGNKVEYLFHKVSLSSDGDLSLIGDEFQVANFSGVAESNSAVSDTSKVLTVRTYDQQA